MDEGKAERELITWFLGTQDEDAIRAGLAEIAPTLWPAFSFEVADELRAAEPGDRELHKRLLGEERRRRE